MATIERVSDMTDERLRDYVRLRDVQLRLTLESERGLFVAEGEKVVRRAVEAGCAVRSFLMAERWLAGLADVLDRSDAPCFVVSEAFAEQVTGFHVHRGALACLDRPAARSADEVLAGATRVVVLEDVVDHTNVGAIIRSAAAFGVDAILLAPRCADPLYRRAVKVAMGAVFSMPWARLPDWWTAVPGLERRGFTTVALTPAMDALDLTDVAAQLAARPVALLVGSEGGGLSARWLEASNIRAKIAMAPEVDSLNVAAATAVACYALTVGSRGQAVCPPSSSPASTPTGQSGG